MELDLRRASVWGHDRLGAPLGDTRLINHVADHVSKIASEVDALTPAEIIAESMASTVDDWNQHTQYWICAVRRTAEDRAFSQRWEAVLAEWGDVYVQAAGAQRTTGTDLPELARTWLSCVITQFSTVFDSPQEGSVADQRRACALAVTSGMRTFGLAMPHRSPQRPSGGRGATPPVESVRARGPETAC